MAHHIYTTSGIVLSLYPSRESDKVVGVMTKEFGLVYATARGARSLSSKLSPALFELALVKISLVKTKTSWRVTSVSLVLDTASVLKERREALSALCRVSFLAKKLLRGEEVNQSLYEDLERSIKLLIEGVADEDVDAWELFTVAKMLSNLGYLSREALPSTLIETREKRRAILSLVNSGIQASGLS